MTEKSMLSVTEALDALLLAVRPITGTETLPIRNANSRVLASAQISQLNVPPMDNAQMDGYAVRAINCAKDVAILKVTQRIVAGQVAQPLQPGTAARIFTGAMIPAGADAIVMQEMCESTILADGESVTIKHVPESGEWIRYTGEDIQAGSVILPAGTRLRAQEIGLAASIGLASLPVMRKLRVAIFSTGNELAMPGEPLNPSVIYNSNGFTLRALLENFNCNVTDYGIILDSLSATREVLRQAATEHDLILTSGGVSVGEADYLRPAVEAEGCLNLWKIAIKPGKPLAFGEVNRSDGNGTAFFIGLPGNPVSSFVTFLLFVRPFLLRLQGVVNVTPSAFAMRADFAWTKMDKRNEFLRAKMNAHGGVDLFPNQGSAVLTSAVWGDGLIDNPPWHSIVPGELIRFIPFSELLY